MRPARHAGSTHWKKRINRPAAQSASDAFITGSAARRRILEAAYKLFSQHGMNAVGIDAIIAEAGVAKMSLYRHFRSKEELVLAFLREREALWTHQWLRAELLAASSKAEERLLAIFDIFDRWFQEPTFEGCAFMNLLLETTPDSPIHSAATKHLRHIRTIIQEQAEAAGLSEPERFASTWHFLMKGSIITAQEGQRGAAKEAKQAGALLLKSWCRLPAAL